MIWGSLLYNVMISLPKHSMIKASVPDASTPIYAGEMESDTVQCVTQNRRPGMGELKKCRAFDFAKGFALFCENAAKGI